MNPRVIFITAAITSVSLLALSTALSLWLHRTDGEAEFD